MAEEPKEIQIQVNVPDKKKAASYSNLFTVTTTQGKEVIIDFVFVHPGDRSTDNKQLGTVVSRVVMSVESAVALKMLLESQLGKNKKE